MKIPSDSIDKLMAQIKADKTEMMVYYKNWKELNPDALAEISGHVIEELNDLLELEDIFIALSCLANGHGTQSETQLLMQVFVLPQKLNPIDTSMFLAAANNKISPKAKNAWSKLKKVVWNFLQSVSMRIWSLLSQFFTPRGWSLSGSIGATFPGFAGNLQMQIDF